MKIDVIKKMFVQIVQTRSLNISPEPDRQIDREKTTIVVYELNNENHQGNSFSLSCSSKQLDEPKKEISPPIVVHRFPTGYGMKQGGVKTVIKLLDQTDEITLIYMEQIPWYFRLFLHTLKITNLDDPRIEIEPSKIKKKFDRFWRENFLFVFSSNFLSTGKRSRTALSIRIDH